MKLKVCQLRVQVLRTIRLVESMKNFEDNPNITGTDIDGALQITRPGLQWAIKRKSEEQISDYYNASLDMVRYRLNITGVLKQWNGRNPN